MTATPMLAVENLSVGFRQRSLLGIGGVVVPAVVDVSFTVQKGETLGLVGESGSGKSTTARAITGLVRPTGGRIRLNGTDVLGARGRRSRELGRQMQMVFQDPYSSLNPAWRVSELVAEPLRAHGTGDRAARDARVAELLDHVGLPRSAMSRYPHEFSGGQRQRIAIARSLALTPDVIIFDEPVSALDVPTQNQVINLLEELRDSFGTTYLVIAHDLDLVRHVSHRVAVMYFGKLVESGPTEQIFKNPRHPYTEALLAASPVPDPVAQRERRARVVRGELPDPLHRPTGCVFATRCPIAVDRCAVEEPALTGRGPDHLAACHLTEGQG